MSDDDIRTMVKEWLQCQKRKSYQLAEEIGIRPQTFYAQMSVRKISANTKKALSRIIPELAADADLNASSSEKENNPEKLKIKEWLRTHGKTRQWLAGTMPGFRPHRAHLVCLSRQHSRHPVPFHRQADE